jgi:hypothetical protein
VKGTELETGTYLDKLKRLSPAEQIAAAERELGPFVAPSAQLAPAITPFGLDDPGDHGGLKGAFSSSECV